MSQSKSNSKAVASYGAALSTVMLATGVDAAVVSLTANPSTINGGATYSNGGATYSRIRVTGDISFTFSMNNSSLYGRNIFGRYPKLNVNQGVLFELANNSSMLSSVAGSNIYNIISYGSAGNRFVGFETSGGNFGYIEFLFEAFGDAKIVNIFAETDPGVAIKVGDPVNVIPLPPSLPIMATGMLALGAAGLRKRRKAKAAALSEEPA